MRRARRGVGGVACEAGAHASRRQNTHSVGERHRRPWRRKQIVLNPVSLYWFILNLLPQNEIYNLPLVLAILDGPPRRKKGTPVGVPAPRHARRQGLCLRVGRYTPRDGK